MEDHKDKIDDSLYSRQRYMLGDNAMHKLSQSSVFLSGLGGVGVEIAKNVVLAGVKVITLHDTKTASYVDLGSNFFLCEDDVHQHNNRAEVCSKSLSELNPYVAIETNTIDIDVDNLDFLKKYQCVVLTDSQLCLQIKIDEFCRCQIPPIQFISTNIFGVFSYLFCDFGPEFEVRDTWTEEPKPFFIGSISKDDPGIVTTLDNMYHGLQQGDQVIFKELVGMETLNESVQLVQNVFSPYSFAIGDTSTLAPYQYGGTGCMVKPSSSFMSFQSLKDQIKNPDILDADFTKTDTCLQLHAAIRAVHVFWERNGCLPQVRSAKDASKCVEITRELSSDINEDVITALSYVSQGYFAPLAAAMGGIAGQEVLKALTSKFKPLKQWLYLDVSEVVALSANDCEEYLPRSDRYDALQICIGKKALKTLTNLNLFMVGCGAIGCEIIKNVSLLGVSSEENSLLTITDDDLIEKSNLNRQFLFRQKDMQKPKSTTASNAALKINPSIHIKALLQRVCPQTEKTIFHDDFFLSQHLVVNALDNIEARRYVDSRCVRNQRGLIETGTMGAKGHVQVIVPHRTENYSSQRDPEDDGVAYCTLKSFPSSIEHTIQWAKDKFENLFIHKVEIFKQFWLQYKTPKIALESIDMMKNLEALVVVTNVLKHKPQTWKDCVTLARNKFEKYFNHKARNLLKAFPVDIRLKDGTPFWKSPKRPPTPIEFNINNKLHIEFLSSISRLYADTHNIVYTPEDLSIGELSKVVSDVKVLEFLPSNKDIITDEAQSKPSGNLKSSDKLEMCRAELTHLGSLLLEDTKFEPRVSPLVFEKDDDKNGHIDFITAAANLRAEMYNIKTVNRLEVKRIAGNIIPAIATTTAAIAGLACIELVKYVIKKDHSEYKNSFINLALPHIVFAEPGAVQRNQIKKGLSYTIWDRWEVHGNKDFTLQQFIQWFKDQYGLDVSLVVQGVRIVYIPIMPGHNKRLKQPMVKLLKLDCLKYADLTVSFADEQSSDQDDLAGPPVRYFIDEVQ